MARLIDADALECDTEWSEYADDYISYSKTEINTAPTIDAVHVVRCEDCKWKANTIGESWCDFHEFTILSDDDFCSYGERKDDEID